MTRPTKRTHAAPLAGDRSRPTPRIKLSGRRIEIDHPDPEAGERLLADALGAVDRDALDGMVKQLAKASTIAHRPDEANLAFMISMVKSIAPRDSIEAMLVAQMVCVHVAAMRCAHHLACAGDLGGQDSASRAFAKLVRIFPAQIEALARHRNNGETAIAVGRLAAPDGNEAIEADVPAPARPLQTEPRLLQAPEQTAMAVISDTRERALALVGTDRTGLA